ncbi:DNA polymerase domain protein, partial [Yersinia pestis PY-11]
MLFRQ